MRLEITNLKCVSSTSWGFFSSCVQLLQVRPESRGDFSLTNGVSTGSYKVEGQDVEGSKIVILVLDDKI